MYFTLENDNIIPNQYFTKTEGKTWACMLYKEFDKLGMTFFRKPKYGDTKSILAIPSGLKEEYCLNNNSVIRFFSNNENKYYLVLSISEDKVNLKEISKLEAETRVLYPDTWESVLEKKTSDACKKEEDLLSLMRIIDAFTKHISKLSDNDLKNTKVKNFKRKDVSEDEAIELLKKHPLAFTWKNGFSGWDKRINKNAEKRIERIKDEISKARKEKKLLSIFSNKELINEIKFELSKRQVQNPYYLCRLDVLGSYSAHSYPIKFQNKYKFGTENWIATMCKDFNLSNVNDFFKFLERYWSQNPLDYDKTRLFFSSRGVCNAGLHTMNSFIWNGEKMQFTNTISFDENGLYVFYENKKYYFEDLGWE